MTRSAYAHCIADTHNDHIGFSLCGRRIGTALSCAPDKHGHVLKELRATEFCFVDADHWFHNARNKGQMLACSECLACVRKMLDQEST